MAYGHYKADGGSEYGSFEVYYKEHLETEHTLNCDHDSGCGDASGYCAAGILCDECNGGACWEDGEGWYYQSCFPGCLPDGDAFGPYDTEEDAFAAAEEGE